MRGYNFNLVLICNLEKKQIDVLQFKIFCFHLSTCKQFIEYWYCPKPGLPTKTLFMGLIHKLHTGP